MTGQRLQAALETVKLFGLDSIYGATPLPKVNANFELPRQSDHRLERDKINMLRHFSERQPGALESAYRV